MGEEDSARSLDYFAIYFLARIPGIFVNNPPPKPLRSSLGGADDATEINRPTFGEGRANSVASQNSVARLRQKLARNLLRARDDVTSGARRLRSGYSVRFPAVSLPEEPRKLSWRRAILVRKP